LSGGVFKVNGLKFLVIKKLKRASTFKNLLRKKMVAPRIKGISSSATDLTKQNGSTPRKFYVFGPDVTGGGKGHGLVFVNEEKLLTPPRLIVKPAEGGFPALKEKPHIAYDPKLGDAPRDIEGGISGYWFISERLKQIFETVDPEGFAFAECDYTLADGSKGPRHYLCDVVRTIDAVDEEKSKLNITISDEFVAGKQYSLLGSGVIIVFKENIVGDAHVFRTPFSGNIFCDCNLYSICKSITDLNGVRFRDATNL